MYGVYRIRNTQNNKCYIGSAATGLSKRWGEHQRLLKSGKHHSIALQRAWSKYGEFSFVFEPLLYCDPENCLTYEQITMDCYKPAYNMCPTAGSCLGIKRSEESKQKMRGPRPQISGNKNPMYGKRGALCPSHGLKRTELTKLRQARARSEFLGKLQEKDIPKIRKLLLEGYTHKEIARQFNVHRSTISRICQGKIWKYV